MKTSMKRPSAPTDAHRTPTALNLLATATFELEAADGAQPAGLPRFRMVAYTGGPMRVAGWRHPVVIDLAGLAIPSQSRPIRFGHDPLSGVGHTDAIRVEQGQLVASGVVSRDTAAAREVVVSSKNGFPWQASLGASVEEFEFVRENQQITVNGQQHGGPLNVVRKATLGEISFVDLGADGATSASVAASSNSISGEPIMDETELTPAAETPVTPTAAAAAPELTANAATSAVEQMRALAAAESERIAAIQRVCAGAPQLAAQAIREGWTAQRAELERLRGERPAVPAAHVANNAVTAAVLEAACALSAGVANPEESFDPRTLEQASRRFRGGIGLQELLLEAAWANGYTGRSFRDSREVLRSAFGRGIEAGFSTVDIGGILSNVANKFLLEGFFIDLCASNEPTVS